MKNRFPVESGMTILAGKKRWFQPFGRNGFMHPGKLLEARTDSYERFPRPESAVLTNYISLDGMAISVQNPSNCVLLA